MPGSSKLICIVDDDPSVRRALGRLIGSFGYQVALCQSGRDCLDGAAIDRAACMILDVSMPGMTGFELHSLLQSAGRSVPTVFISAHDDRHYLNQADALGIEFLKKPCDGDLLHDAINRAIA